MTDDYHNVHAGKGSNKTYYFPSNSHGIMLGGHPKTPAVLRPPGVSITRLEHMLPLFVFPV